MLVVEIKEQKVGRGGESSLLGALHGIVIAVFFTRSYFYFKYIDVLPTPMYDVCTSHVCLVSSRVRNMLSDPLELE